MEDLYIDGFNGKMPLQEERVEGAPPSRDVKTPLMNFDWKGRSNGW